MTIQTRKYSVDYCSVLIPENLAENIPVEFRNSSTNEYSRLKDGIEVTADNLNELVNNSPDDYAAMPKQWQDFLMKVSEISVDSYIFHC